MWLYGDSFDGYTDLSTRYNLLGASGQAIGIGEGRFGTNCAKFTTTSGRITKGITPGVSTAGTFASMAMKWTPSGSTGLFGFAGIWDASTGFGHIIFTRNVDGTISVWRLGFNETQLTIIPSATIGFGGALLGTTAARLHQSIYESVEVFGLVHGSAGAVGVRVNGEELLALTGINTKNSHASANYTSWDFGQGSGGGNGILRADDLMIYDDFDNSDGGPTDYVGDLSGEFCMVSGAGAHADMTRNSGATNASCVDENPPDDDTTYVEDGTVNHLDTYTHAALTRIVSGIRCVQVVTVAKKTGAGTRAIAGVIRRSGTDYPGADEYLGTDYAIGFDPRPFDPSTAGAWSAANVNAAEIGQKVTI